MTLHKKKIKKTPHCRIIYNVDGKTESLFTPCKDSIKPLIEIALNAGAQEVLVLYEGKRYLCSLSPNGTYTRKELTGYYPIEFLPYQKETDSKSDTVELKPAPPQRLSIALSEKIRKILKEKGLGETGWYG